VKGGTTKPAFRRKGKTLVNMWEKKKFKGVKGRRNMDDLMSAGRGLGDCLGDGERSIRGMGL